MRGDLLLRLGPFAAAVLLAWLWWRPAWLGLALGDLRAQLLFGGIGCLALFLGAVALQVPLTRRRGGLKVPADGGDAALQGAYYVLNGPLEEAFYRLEVLERAAQVYVLSRLLGRLTSST